MNHSNDQRQDTANRRFRIGILSRNPETLKSLDDFLRGDADAVQSQIWPADENHLPAMVDRERPDLLLLETPGNQEDELRGLEATLIHHPGLVAILICPHPTPAFLLAAMRVGVREVLTAPLDAALLQQAVARVRGRQATPGQSGSPGQVIVFMPCKGGSGSTFIASNLACAIAAGKRRVCLIDLNLHFGDAALHVSEQTPSTTVVDLVAQIQRLDSALLAASQLHINPWFDLLAAPDSPARAADVRPEHIERLIEVARNSYDFVLLDVSRTLDVNVVKALDCADRIYLVLQATLPFVRDASRLLQIFASLDYTREKTHLLINRHDNDGEIALADIERTLHQKIARTIPNSFRVVTESINHGRPVIDLAPRNPVARSLREMASALTREAQDGGAWWQRLFGYAA